MAVETEAQLKARFLTGETMDQVDFDALIETLISKGQSKEVADLVALGALGAEDRGMIVKVTSENAYYFYSDDEGGWVTPESKGLTQNPGTSLPANPTSQGIYPLNAPTNSTLPAATGSLNRFYITVDDGGVGSTIGVQSGESLNGSVDGVYTANNENAVLMAIDSAAGEWSLAPLGAGQTVSRTRDIDFTGTTSSISGGITVGTGTNPGGNSAIIAPSGRGRRFADCESITVDFYFDTDPDFTVTFPLSVIDTSQGHFLKGAEMAVLNPNSEAQTNDIEVAISGTNQVTFNRVDSLSNDVALRLTLTVQGFEEEDYILAGMVPIGGASSDLVGAIIPAPDHTERTVANGWFKLEAGNTISGGATDYPIFAAAWPTLVSGSDLVVPADWDGIFLRNLGGNAAAAGVYQDDATDINGLSINRPTSYPANASGSVNFAYSPNSSGGTQTGGINLSSTDPETRPENVAVQFWGILDNHKQRVVMPDAVNVDNASFTPDLVSSNTDLTTGTWKIQQGNLHRIGQRVSIDVNLYRDDPAGSNAGTGVYLLPLPLGADLTKHSAPDNIAISIVGHGRIGYHDAGVVVHRQEVRVYIYDANHLAFEVQPFNTQDAQSIGAAWFDAGPTVEEWSLSFKAEYYTA